VPTIAPLKKVATVRWLAESERLIFMVGGEAA
jgi:hypothetical protein